MKYRSFLSEQAVQIRLIVHHDMDSMAVRFLLILVGSGFGQPPPQGGDDVDEIMQIFLDPSAGGHLPFEPINVDEWDPFAGLVALNVGGVGRTC